MSIDARTTMELGLAFWRYLTEPDPEDPDSGTPAFSIEDTGLEVEMHVFIPISRELAETLRDLRPEEV